MTRSDPISAVQRHPPAAHLNIDSRPRLAANLVKAGCLVCSEKDIENFTVSQLLRRIRISRGTFYKYFNNKDDFFAFLVLMVDEQVRLKLKRAAAHIEDPAAVVCALLVIYAKYGRDYPREAAVLLKWSSAGLPMTGPRSIDIRSEIGAGLKAARFDGISADAACLAVSGTANALLARAIDPDMHSHLEATVADLAATVLRFLGVPREEVRHIVSASACHWS